VTDDLAILHIEVFEFLAGLVVDNFAVAQHPINIEEDGFDVGGFLDLFFGVVG